MTETLNPKDFRRACVMLAEFCTAVPATTHTDAILAEVMQDDDPGASCSRLIQAVLMTVTDPELNPNRDVWAKVLPMLAMHYAEQEGTQR